MSIPEASLAFRSSFEFVIEHNVVCLTDVIRVIRDEVRDPEGNSDDSLKLNIHVLVGIPVAMPRGHCGILYLS